MKNLFNTYIQTIKQDSDSYFVSSLRNFINGEDIEKKKKR